MINLLPSYQKKKLFDEMKWRFLASLFLMISLTGLLLSIILYALNLVSAKLIPTEKDRISQVEAEISTAVLRGGEIMSFNKAISELLSVYAGSADMTETFRLLHEAFPLGSRVDSIRYERSLNEKKEIIHKMTVTGYAPEWESMLKIEAGLKERFDNVSLSPGVWTRLTDIDFSIDFTLR